MSENLVSLSVPADPSGGIDPLALQVYSWSFLFTAANSLEDGADKRKEFRLLIQLMARLFPDHQAREVFERILMRPENEDLFEKAQSQQDVVLWLHSIHDQVSAQVEHPFKEALDAHGLGSARSRRGTADQQLTLFKSHARWGFSGGRVAALLTEESASLLSRALPDELLLEVFSELDPQSLLRASRVSRRWRRLSSDKAVWKRLFAQHFCVEHWNEVLLRIRDSEWRRAFFEWRTWDHLNFLFDEEPDAPENIVFERDDEEWVVEDREVEVLDAHQLLQHQISLQHPLQLHSHSHGGSPLSGSPGSAATSATALGLGAVEGESNDNSPSNTLLRRPLTHRRRRKRLSLVLEASRGASSRNPLSLAAAAAQLQQVQQGSHVRRVLAQNQGQNLGGSMAAVSADMWASQHRNYLRLLNLQPLPSLRSLLPPLSLSNRAQREREDRELMEIKSGSIAANTRPSRTLSQLRRLKLAVSGSKIRAATLPKLVEYLTTPYSHDLEYMKTFLLTYPHFTTPEVLLALLIRRYFVQQPREFGSIDEWQRHVQKPIQLRVINIIKSWIENYFTDFDESLVKCLERFASHVLVEKLSRQILAILQRQKHSSAAARSKDYQFSEFPPTPEVPKNIFSPRLALWEVSELELARQLTILEFNLFSAVTPRELLNFAHSHEADAGLTSNVAASLARFRGTARWVHSSITSFPKVKEKAKLAKRFVVTAQELLKLNNFNTLMAVLVGLQEVRTKCTDVWDELSKRWKLELSAIETIVTDERVYQDTLAYKNMSRIPYLEFHLRKIRAAERGIPSTEGKLINFSKAKYLYSMVSQIMQYQQTPYNLQPVAQIAALLTWTPLQGEQERDESPPPH